MEGELEGCPGGTLTYSAFVVADLSPVEVSWSVQSLDGDVLWQSTTASATHDIPLPEQAGLYRVVALPGSPDDYCTARAERIIRVLSLPGAPTSIEGPGVVCPNETVTYTALGTSFDAYVQWAVTHNGSTETLTGNPLNVTWGSPPYQISAVQINIQGAGCTSAALQKDIVPLSDLSVSGPSTACVDATSIFDAAPILDMDYDWSISPASAATIVTPPDSSTAELLWHQPGNATVQVAACGLTASTLLNVKSRLTPEVIAPTGLCPGETATVQTTQNYASYLWTDSLGNTLSTDPMPSLAAGSYRLAVTDEEGCGGTTNFSIAPYPAPDTYISTPDLWIYCGEVPTVNMYATNTEEGYNYQWYRGGIPVGANTPIHTTDIPGKYSVVVTNQSGCTAQSNVVHIREDCEGGECGSTEGSSCEDLPIDFDFTIASGTTCGEQVLTNVSSGYIPGSAFWQVYDQDEDVIASGSGDSFTVIFGEPTFFNVQLTLQFPDPNNPGENIWCEYWKVGGTSLVAKFTTQPACAAAPFEFTDLSTHLPNTSVASWQWDFGDPASGAANLSTLPNPVHLFSAPGDYTVQLTVTDGSGCSSQHTQIIQVPEPPQPGFELPVSICADIAAAFVPIEENLAWVQWDFGDPASGDANTQTAPLRTVDTPGLYTLWVTNACEAIQLSTQVALPSYDTRSLFYVPNAFSPNGDGRNDHFHFYTDPNINIIDLEFFVYDRYGGELFQTNDPQVGWDGDTEGQPLNTGLYVWYLSATVEVCGRVVQVEEKGGVQVVR